MNMNELKLMQNYPLDIKIAKTKNRIREFYEYFDGEVYIAFSGGNDSLVMLHIIRSLYPDVTAVFVDTGVEFPEVRKFVKSFDNVVILKPEKNFSQIINEYGYPVISKDVSNSIRLARKNIADGKVTERVKQFNGSMKGSRFNKEKWRFLLESDFKISEFSLSSSASSRFWANFAWVSCNFSTTWIDGSFVETTIFLAFSTILLSNPKFVAIAIALLNPGIPISNLYVGFKVVVLNSTDAFLKYGFVYSRAFNSP